MPVNDERSASALLFRDALSDDVEVPAHVLYDNVPHEPTLTIAIPTFRRPALLVEAVRSAVSQDFHERFEVLIVDNDPDTPGWAALLDAVPDLASAPIRYVVNDRNIGMLGNWNRCIVMARGEWLTILNDDDLIDPDFAKTMLAIAIANEVDGLVCGKRILDQRDQNPRNHREAFLWTVKRLIAASLFYGRETRPITARQMFWGNPIGNPVGFLSRTARFRDLGGFYPEDYPSADYFLFTRFALQFRVAQTYQILASIRVAENESMRTDVLHGFLQAEYRIQKTLTASVLPRWWARISPWLIGYHVERSERMWRVALDPELLQRRIGIRYRRGHHLWLNLLRAALGGF